MKSQVFKVDKREIFQITQENILNQDLQNFELLQFSIQYYEEILINRTLKKLPISINLTFALLQYIIQNDKNYEKTSSKIVNYLNQIVDLNQKVKIKQSFFQTLLNLQFDQDAANIISEFRHSFTHKIFPSQNILDFVVAFLLKFLQDNFWKITIKKNISKLNFLKLENILTEIEMAYEHQLDLKFILDKVKNKNNFEQNEIQNEIKSLLYCKDTMSIKKKIKKLKMKNIEEKILQFLLKKNSQANQAQKELMQNYFLENTNISMFRNNFKKQKFKNLIYKILIKKDLNKNFENFWDLFYTNFDRILKKDNFIKEYLELQQDQCQEIDESSINNMYEKIISQDLNFAYKKIFIDF